MRDEIQKVREASLAMAVLTQNQKKEALEKCSELLIKKMSTLLAANQKDLEEQKGQISQSLFQRLELTENKIKQLSYGMLEIAKMDNPCGQVQMRRELDQGLMLERVSVPLGVVGVIFESRPDAVPQILSLILMSGNAAILKGGKEALHSNQAIMSLFTELGEGCPFLPKHWAILLESREEVHEMLKHDDLIDLVIPRGSNDLVRTVMEGTKIPVLGHADGICHAFLDESAELDKALPLIVDAKAQYPSACNALETLLIHKNIYPQFFQQLEKACTEAGIEIVKEENVENWATEYGDLKLAVKPVEDMKEAITHINTYGSKHTDVILTSNPVHAEEFLKRVDSASVMVNASTRFADGFRYGMGAEVGIATSKTHARGPVGIEGLVIYKYKLRGNYQCVVDYTGNAAKAFSHKNL